MSKDQPSFVLRRSRPIAFVVTRDEYELLKNEYVASGERSVADLVREKVLRGIRGQSLAGIAKKLDQLEHAVKELSEAVCQGRSDQYDRQSMGGAHGG